jgi:chromate transporter
MPDRSDPASPLPPARSALDEAAAGSDARPTAPQLFVAFAKIAVCGFGGVMAWSRRVLVQERAWLTPQGFNEVMALCQVLPGPNVVNVSVVFGARSAGLAGALAALAGLIGPPTLMMIGAGMLYARFSEMPELRGLLAGLAAAAAGLILATAVQMAEPLARARPDAGHAVALVTFLAVGVVRLPLIQVLAVMIPLAIAAAWWRRRA